VVCSQRPPLPPHSKLLVQLSPADFSARQMPDSPEPIGASQYRPKSQEILSPLANGPQASPSCANASVHLPASPQWLKNTSHSAQPGVQVSPTNLIGAHDFASVGPSQWLGIRHSKLLVHEPLIFFARHTPGVSMVPPSQ
jgi:hypothetical protein